jgi:hypothetical protein
VPQAASLCSASSVVQFAEPLGAVSVRHLVLSCVRHLASHTESDHDNAVLSYKSELLSMPFVFTMEGECCTSSHVMVPCSLRCACVLQSGLSLFLCLCILCKCLLGPPKV